MSPRRPLQLATALLATTLLSGCCLLSSGGCFAPPKESEADRAARIIKNFARSEVVSAGLAHTCARSYEAVYCWGDNRFGALGVGMDVAGSPIPLAAKFPGAPFPAVHTVFAGATHSCAVLSEAQGARQQLYCWGDNDTGQLGDGTRERRYLPVAVLAEGGAPLQGILKVDGGAGHGCAMQGNLDLPRAFGGDEPSKLYCWGRNDQGQVTGFARQTPSDVEEIPFLASIRDFAAGLEHTCAVTGEGTVLCWGRNAATGELFDRSVPIDGLGDVRVITAGFDHTCALTNSGSTFCWGANDHGQLGDGTTTASATPRPVPGTFVELSAGGEFTCGRRIGGIQCWGRNDRGQLGDGLQRPSSTPVDVANLGGIVTDVSAGATHACSKANKSVFDGASGLRCWGEGANGQLGDGALLLSNLPLDPAQNPFLVLQAAGAGKGQPEPAVGSRPRGPREWSPSWAAPVPVVGFTQNLSDIDAGRKHTCLLGNGGVPYCWGANRDGEIGNDALGVDQFTPVTPVGLEGGVLSIAAGGTFAVGSGGGFTCAVDGDGALYCWGDNGFRQLADGTTTDRPVPQAVAGLSGPAVKVSSSTYNSCVLLEDGTVECLTDDIPGSTFGVPEPIADLDGVIDIAVGEFHLCALKASGRVECIGNSSTGAIGCTGGDLVPCEVTDIPDATAVAAGPFASCALTADGGVWCWGSHPGDGQCNGTSNVPVQPIGLDAGVTSLALGPVHSCAVKGEQGALYCWGRNPSGALGFDPVDTCFSEPAATQPTLVPGFESGVLGVAAGAEHTCVIINDRLQCFGSNAEGQLASEMTTSKGMAGELGQLIDLVTQLFAEPPMPEDFLELDPGEPELIQTIPRELFFAPSPSPTRQEIAFAIQRHDPDGVLLPLDPVDDTLVKGTASPGLPNTAKVAFDENGDLLIRPSGKEGAVLIDVSCYFASAPVGELGYGSSRCPVSTLRLFLGDGVDLSLASERRVDGISVDRFETIGADRIAAVTSYLAPADGKGNAAQAGIDLRYQASNEGPFDVTGARFVAQVAAPSDGLTITWTCLAPSGPCSPAVGEGDIDTRFDLAVGDSAEIRIIGTGPAGDGFLDVQATLTPPPGIPVFLSDDDSVISVVPLSREGLFGNGFE